MQGVIAAVPTPIDDQGKPVKAPFVDHCAWALANGCDGLNILGSTGEANSFATADRMAVMEWAAKGVDVARLMVGTGTPSLAETVALTRHAADLGYGVALVLPPYYYKPASDAGLIAWYDALHHALGDLPIQIYFYNFPQMTGLTIPVNVIAALATRHPARFAGIKDSSGDLGYCRDVLAAVPGFRVFPSSETALAEAHASGFAGCISATVNITAPTCARIWADRAAPDAADTARVAADRAAIAARPLIPAIKHLVGARTGDAGWARVLPPFVALDADTASALEAALSQ